MILFYDQAVAILTPPKTGSTTAIRTLCQSPHDGILCIGPTPDEERYFDHHSAVMPPDPGRKWGVVAILRDPVDRIKSLWSHYNANERARKLMAPLSPEEYARTLATTGFGFYFYDHNLAKLVGSIQLEFAIRTEWLDDELAKLGFATKQVRWNQSILPSEAEWFNSREASDILDWWFEPDRELISETRTVDDYVGLSGLAQRQG